jgi:Kef-type K+ transport system membrane component KefB
VGKGVVVVVGVVVLVVVVVADSDFKYACFGAIKLFINVVVVLTNRSVNDSLKSSNSERWMFVISCKFEKVAVLFNWSMSSSMSSISSSGIWVAVVASTIFSRATKPPPISAPCPIFFKPVLIPDHTFVRIDVMLDLAVIEVAEEPRPNQLDKEEDDADDLEMSDAREAAGMIW